MPAEEYHKLLGKIHDIPMLIETIGEGNNYIFTNSYVYTRIHGNSDSQNDNTGITLEQFKNWINYYKKFAETNPKLKEVYNKHVYDRACMVYKYHLSSKEKQTCQNIEEFLKKENLLFTPVDFWQKTRTKWFLKPFNRLTRSFYNTGYYKQFLNN